MGSIELRSVSKSFGRHQVLRDVSIDVAEGEFVVFVGPSGCGKSTLLRLLSGLEAVNGGRILIAGNDVTDLPPKDRDIAMVFQNYALYPHMTVAENIAFPLRIQGIPYAARMEDVKGVAALLDLSAYLERYPRELSGGQRQRVAMGRAIVRHPQVFLFDEPLSNLDAALRAQMRKEIKILHARLGSTMIFVTHDQVEAMTMADKIVVLRDGEVEQFGTPHEVYRRPANTFVARFIGSPPINLIRCTVHDGHATPEGNGVSFPLRMSTHLENGKKVMIGIRPEDIGLTDKAEGGWTGKVSYVETTGQDTLVNVVNEWGNVNASLRGALAVAVGDTVTVDYLSAPLHVFDVEGERIE